MQVRFISKRLQALIMNRHAVTRKYGDRAASNLALRLRQLLKEPHAGALLQSPGHWHALRGDRSGQIAAVITRSLRLILISSDKSPSGEGKSIDWRLVDDVTVLEIIDYH